MTEYSEFVRCRMCLGGTKVVMTLPPKKLNFGNEHDIKYPLELVECGSCGHVQIRYEIPGSKLFGEYYTYRTPDTENLRLSEYAQRLAKDYSGLALEIGSNNGYFLRALMHAGFTAYGIDPIANNGMPKWFTSKSAKQIANTIGQFDLIVSIDTLDQMDDIRNCFRAVSIALKPSGTFVFDVPYLPEKIKGGFSFVCHERKDYHTLKPFPLVLKKFGLGLEKIQRFGDSVRLFVKKDIKSVDVTDACINWELERAA